MDTTMCDGGGAHSCARCAFCVVSLHVLLVVGPSFLPSLLFCSPCPSTQLALLLTSAPSLPTCCYASSHTTTESYLCNQSISNYRKSKSVSAVKRQGKGRKEAVR
jgi:hypothetical protein